MMFDFVVSQDVKKKRMDICQSCEHLVSFDRCKLCGCFMQYKTLIPNASCPINKWSEEQEDTNEQK